MRNTASLEPNLASSKWKDMLNEAGDLIAFTFPPFRKLAETIFTDKKRRKRQFYWECNGRVLPQDYKTLAGCRVEAMFAARNNLYLKGEYEVEVIIYVPRKKRYKFDINIVDRD